MSTYNLGWQPVAPPKQEYVKSYENFVLEKLTARRAFAAQQGRPLYKISQLRFTVDGRYCILEGRAYSTLTGEEVPLNEEWTLSDTLHLGADLLSAGMDFVVPGSGAIIDAVNAISYIIEAQFKESQEEKDSLYIMAAITAAFVLLPGPLQAIAVPLKQAVKTGKGFASAVVKNGLKIIASTLDTLLVGLPSLAKKALGSTVGKKVLGKWSTKITGWISSFTSRISTILSKFTGKAAPTVTGTVAKKTVLSTITAAAKTGLTNFAKRMPRIPSASVPLVFKKLGFAQGKSYRYLATTGANAGKVTTVTIKQIGTDGKILAQFGKRGAIPIPAETFTRNCIVEPWFRQGAGVAVPLFVKQLSDILMSDGSDIDYKSLENMQDLDPDAVSQESLSYLQEEVADYEGDSGTYTSSASVTNFQNALISLGYSLPKAGADGKFGPETKQSLEKFQTDNVLTSSLGKMDRLTARKMAELLKSKAVAGSEPLQAALNAV